MVWAVMPAMGSGKSSFSELPTAHLQLCISVQSSALILS